MRLGLVRGEVEVVNHDPGWASVYQDVAQRIREAFGGDIDIEHVGSTAVEGLVAKPIVDLAVGVTEETIGYTQGVAQIIAAMHTAGFEFRNDAGERGGLIFVLDAGGVLRRIAHVHIVERNSIQWQSYLTVRDRLREDPAARDAYGMLKQSLAAKYPHERGNYTAAKAAFVEALLKPAQQTMLAVSEADKNGNTVPK